MINITYFIRKTNRNLHLTNKILDFTKPKHLSMNKTVQILLSIADDASLHSMDEWEQFMLFDKPHFLNQLTYDIFQVLVDGYGTNLSKWELAKSLNIEDSNINNRLFSVINNNSKTISYEEFHDFCALGQKHHIISLLKELGIYNKLYKESCNNSNMDVNIPLTSVEEQNEPEDLVVDKSDKQSCSGDSTELDYKGNNPAEKSNSRFSQFIDWCNQLYSTLFKNCLFSKK